VVATWFEQIGAGVAAAHAQHIVHRDLKPENVIITSVPAGRDRVKVLDFGLAKMAAIDRDETGALTHTGAVMGTAGYMAPEQLTGGETDERTDIFALGVMVAESVTGTRPFDGRTASELLLAIVQAPLTLPGAGPAWRGLEAVLQKAVAKKPADRYPSVDEFIGKVTPALRGIRTGSTWNSELGTENGGTC
jgi:serine/threonine-protein kinase